MQLQLRTFALVILLLAGVAWSICLLVLLPGAPVRRERLSRQLDCARCWRCSRLARATTLLVLVVILWTASSVATQSLVFEKAHYRKPFFITYLSTAGLMVYLPMYAGRFSILVRAACGKSPPRYEAVPRATYGTASDQVPPTLPSVSTASPASTATAASAATTASSSSGAALHLAAQPGPTRALGTAGRLGVLYFSYQLFFNLGLELSTVSATTVISASSGLWTLLFSALLLAEPVGAVKLASVALSFLGVVAVVMAAPRAEDGPGGAVAPAWGNAATLSSAFLYGGYAALLKRDASDEEELPMPFLFGLIGLVCAVMLAPLLLWLDLVGLERFGLPTGPTAAAIAANTLLGSVLSNVLLAKAMLLASPLLATVGLSLSIPLALASDAVRGRGRFTAPMMLGTLALWLGFVGVASVEPIEQCCAGLAGRCRARRPTHQSTELPGA